MRSKTCKYKFVIFACFKFNLMLFVPGHVGTVSQ